MQQTTSLVVQYLRDKHGAGETVTFKALEAEFYDDFQYKQRPVLSSALKILQRDYNILFASVIGVGYRPIPNDLAAQAIMAYREGRIKSQVRKFRGELETVDPSQLTEESDLRDYITAYGKLNILEQATSERFRQLESAAQQQPLQCNASAGWRDWMRTAIAELSNIS